MWTNLMFFFIMLTILNGLKTACGCGCPYNHTMTWSYVRIAVIVYDVTVTVYCLDGRKCSHFLANNN